MITDLIINSGIQYISIPLNLNDEIAGRTRESFKDELIEQTENGDVYELKEIYYWRDAELYIDKNTINAEAYSRFGVLNPDEISRNYVNTVSEDDFYTVSGKEALKVCEGHWIPVPYFRIRQDIQEPFHHGPENWCRMNIQPKIDKEKNTTHILTLAFDTTAIEDESNYFNPRRRDANDNGSERFKCVTEKRHARKFYTENSLWEWMFNLYWLETNPERKNRQQLRHVAIYHTLIKLLESTEAFPEIGLLSGENVIEVGLTLDIGNSRTCGIICEKSRQFDSLPFDFTSARKLQIRNLRTPHLVCEDPFEMQVAFSEEKFGNPASELIDNVFQWPSLVRVGPEAVELTSIFESEDSQATISSPKRYLWDKKPVKIPWIKVDIEGRHGFHEKAYIRQNALYGIAQYVTSEGRYIKPEERENLMAATESRFSRSSVMMFAIYEILLQVISQINDHEFRRDLGNSTYRRILKDIVITCPTAMTIQEQHTLRKSVIDATLLLQETLGDKIDFSEKPVEVFPPLPSLDPASQEDNPWKYDEATCSQLAFLYGELVHKYSSNQKLFFGLNGKYRNESPHKSINIASIDIGGGTTDLMICNYTFDGDTDVPYLTPNPIFWEGFSLAGDDIVKRVIEKIIIPSIHTDIEQKGGKNVVAIINELFGQNIGGQTARQKIYRRQFANLIGIPAAHKIFDYLINPGFKSYSFNIEEIFSGSIKPSSGLIEYINHTISLKTGIDDYDICDVEIQVDPAIVNSGVKDVMGDVLKQLSYLISFFDSDIILLSGRPSRLPVITDIISSTLNFGMNKIVNLGDYRFGNWYPFADSSGYVNDPKSTVCVGSLIAYLNEINRLPKLRFDLNLLNDITTTAKFLGIINFSGGRGSIKNDNILLSSTINESSFMFHGGPIAIGMKQLESEEWIATSLYLFDYKDDSTKTKLNKEFKLPYLIKIKRLNTEGEFIDKEDIEVEDSNGMSIDNQNFNFLLKTSNSLDLHWKDSGSFITRIE